MRVAKRYLLLAVILLIYITAITTLLHQFNMYQKMYMLLASHLGHTSIEVIKEDGEDSRQQED